MKEFDKWYKNIEKEYPLYQDKDGYNIGNTRALKVGWRAALRWISDGIEDTEAHWLKDIIDDELEKEE